MIFVLYWLVKIKFQLILSLFVLVLGFSHIKSSFNFNSTNDSNTAGIEIMSFNVHLLNLYNWIDSINVPNEFLSFIKIQSPDVLCVQEYESSIALDLNYPYFYGPRSKNKSELVIFSKFKIISSGLIDFPNSSNRAVFSDLIIKSDTIRIYNLHLQSTGISIDIQELDANKSDKLVNQLSSSFIKQQEQAELLVSHLETSPYKIVVCGDFNNTAYSYVYKILRGNMLDSFEVAGNGFGSTFSIDYFPLRIDFILSDPSFKILEHTNFTFPYSDHYPISSKFIIP